VRGGSGVLLVVLRFLLFCFHHRSLLVTYAARCVLHSSSLLASLAENDNLDRIKRKQYFSFIIYCYLPHTAGADGRQQQLERSGGSAESPGGGPPFARLCDGCRPASVASS
jgi:hypothetical protein